ncbi:hypothetical protein TTRE_0000524401 [Trichuris trichiura]|uniref:Integrase catalytic domain-containing protein n=1 Tax=Trichuris trichiura TaxID=36087 RepID=A0A077Z9R2_TRITR|nr:hypothetical protein TTRE_0000524401 [Trichuris trichiura]
MDVEMPVDTKTERLTRRDKILLQVMRWAMRSNVIIPKNARSKAPILFHEVDPGAVRMKTLGQRFFIVIDSCSKWLEVLLARTATTATIDNVAMLLAAHGLPNVMF